jgi:hypothetical protein
MVMIRTAAAVRSTTIVYVFALSFSFYLLASFFSVLGRPDLAICS